jgi:hypothetical protein
MGELFEEAINKGYLNAVQTQHPGFYFHSAANHATQRRLNRKSFYPEASVSRTWTAENPSPIESLASLEYYGQRPWRQCQQTMEILDQQREKEGIVCLHEMELGENLTVCIHPSLLVSSKRYLKSFLVLFSLSLPICSTKRSITSKYSTANE